MSNSKHFAYWCRFETHIERDFDLRNNSPAKLYSPHCHLRTNGEGVLIPASPFAQLSVENCRETKGRRPHRKAFQSLAVLQFSDKLLWTSYASDLTCSIKTNVPQSWTHHPKQYEISNSLSVFKCSIKTAAIRHNTQDTSKQVQITKSTNCSLAGNSNFIPHSNCNWCDKVSYYYSSAIGFCCVLLWVHEWVRYKCASGSSATSYHQTFSEEQSNKSRSLRLLSACPPISARF